MDLNQILVWVVLATSILGLVCLVMARVRMARGWLIQGAGGARVHGLEVAGEAVESGRRNIYTV